MPCCIDFDFDRDLLAARTLQLIFQIRVNIADCLLKSFL